jgi:CubicO group peptidase (beta-lactamase class C family)
MVFDGVTRACACVSLIGTLLGAWVVQASAQGSPAVKAPSLASAARSAAELQQLRSLLVSWRGELILEHYAPGVRASRPANVKSVSKSVISTLVGIALHRKLIKSLDEPIVSYFPELRRDPDRRKAAITTEDLLTMRSGLASTSGENYGAWVTSRNWVRAALARPMVSEPGTTMEYSTGSSHLLSAILTKATKKSTWQFAQETLGAPLGITFARWPRDPQGIFFGGNDMLLTPRQMLAFGQLWLNDGRAKGRPIVPQAWVQTSCEGRGRSRFNPDQQYGYGWWTREFAGREACFAWGYGGQYIFVFADLDLVVVTTSSTTAGEERRGHRRLIFDLLETHILGPIS